MLVFAFAPLLAALPRWLAFEATNPLNAEDAVVLAFVPIRAAVLLIRTFLGGVVQGVLAGVIDGVLVSAWVAWRGVPQSRAQTLAVGAGGGALAAVLMIAALALQVSEQGLPAAAVAFEAATGVVCGMLAAPRAIRLLVSSA